MADCGLHFYFGAQSPMRSPTGLTPKIGDRPGKLTENGPTVEVVLRPSKVSRQRPSPELRRHLAQLVPRRSG